jgi:hypothetical protein
MKSPQRNILLGITTALLFIWGYAEAASYALNLGAAHHDARCRDHGQQGAAIKVG